MSSFNEVTWLNNFLILASRSIRVYYKDNFLKKVILSYLHIFDHLRSKTAFEQ